MIARILWRFTDLPTRDEATLLPLAEDWAVSELRVRPEDWVAGKTLSDLELRERGVRVPGMSRSNGGYEGEPDGGTQVREGDLLVLYGREELIRELDDRLATADT